MFYRRMKRMDGYEDFSYWDSQDYIGFHVAKQLLDQDVIVVGIDNLNNYYDVALKEARLKVLAEHPNAAL